MAENAPWLDTIPALLPRTQARVAKTGPDQTFIHRLHRGPGFITYAVKRDGKLHRIGAMPVGQPWLPGLDEMLTVDGYVSVNTSFRPGIRITGEHWGRPRPLDPEYYPGATIRDMVPTRQRIEKSTGLHFAHHDAKSLRWLNACYVDLDCYRLGRDVESTIAEILRRQERGVIPPATMFGRSGRGLWLFWYLIDELNPANGTTMIRSMLHGSDTPQRDCARARRAYARVQGALLTRLRDLGADARDPASFTRVPGSINTVAGDAVVHWWAQGTGGTLFYFTLQQLRDALNLEDPVTDHPLMADAHRDPDDRFSAYGRRGWIARWRNLSRDIENLIAMRGGGFAQGCRNRGAYYFAFALQRLGVSTANVEMKVSTYAARCRPPLTPREWQGAIGSASMGKGKIVRNDTVSYALCVTDQETEVLPSFRHEPTTPPIQQQAETAEERQRTILAITQAAVDAGRPPPSIRRILPDLHEAGFRANAVTVWRDYKKLGLSMNRKGGRPAAPALF